MNEAANAIGAPSFREFMDHERIATDVDRVLVQAIANLTTEGEYRSMTRNEVYNLLVARASWIAEQGGWIRGDGLEER